MCNNQRNLKNDCILPVFLSFLSDSVLLFCLVLVFKSSAIQTDPGLVQLKISTREGQPVLDPYFYRSFFQCAKKHQQKKP